MLQVDSQFYMMNFADCIATSLDCAVYQNIVVKSMLFCFSKINKNGTDYNIVVNGSTQENVLYGNVLFPSTTFELASTHVPMDVVKCASTNSMLERLHMSLLPLLK